MSTVPILHHFSITEGPRVIRQKKYELAGIFYLPKSCHLWCGQLAGCWRIR